MDSSSTKTNACPDEEIEGVAIIGMSGRFPKARNIDEYWEHIKKGNNCISTFNEAELESSPDYALVSEHERFVAAKGILEDVELFDAKFWGYTPKEAATMDPQQRIFLECAWDALENAGYDSDRYDGAIGCFGGCYFDTYLLSNLCSQPGFLANLVKSIQVGNLQTELGNDKDYVATRAAFKLNLRGPAVNVQCACSTSLVAISMACQSLLAYQSDMCLAGGVTLTLPQRKGYFYTPGGMLSKDGKCRTFDESAAGTVFSNAGAVILLKRESEAIADGDHIYAVIKGTALNNDGGDKQSFTAPSVQGQAEVIAMAQAMAGVNPRTIGLIEAHGTATPLGDPIEVAGLTQAFSELTDDKQFCALGSVKANIGHLDVASGVAGVIKTALALKHQMLPPLVHFKAPNPKIDFSSTPFYINTHLQHWQEQAWPRRAGVSSFGVGGTNAHVVMEEAVPRAREKSEPQLKSSLLVLSAQTESALIQQARNFSDFMRRTDLSLHDICYTSQVGRRVFEHRACFVGNNKEEMIDKLEHFEAAGLDYKKNDEHDRSVVFMFPGQGAQYPGMARELYQRYPVFAQTFDECCHLLGSQVGLDLKASIFNCDDAETLKQTTIAQPAIFTTEYALAKLWLSWGVKPSALIGHSVGEYCAACLAGVFSLEDALLLVARRGEFMQEMPSGSMLSVRACATQLTEYLSADVSLAAINAPKLCVLAGPDRDIFQSKEKLEALNIPCSLLHTSHAFHSSMMDAAVGPTLDVVAGLQLDVPSIPVMSTVTGEWLSNNDALDPGYWGRNLRDTVKFANGIEALLEERFDLFLEVGPGQTLATLSAQTAKSLGLKHVTTLASLSHVQSQQSDEEAINSAVGRLWIEGASIEWSGFNGGQGYRVPMPGYPFERKRHWVNPGDLDARAADNADTGGHGDAPVRDVPELEKLIKNQLEVLAQQLQLLGKR